MLAGGRWHRAGRPVVYLADSPASAMLEVLVHLEVDAEDVPDNLKLLRIEIPDSASMQNLADHLPEQWEDNPAHTRALGDDWLAKNQTLLLQVPSAIMPHTQNYLFNPQHAEAGLAKVEVETLKLDGRLLKGRSPTSG